MCKWQLWLITAISNQGFKKRSDFTAPGHLQGCCTRKSVSVHCKTSIKAVEIRTFTLFAQQPEGYTVFVLEKSIFTDKVYIRVTLMFSR